MAELRCADARQKSAIESDRTSQEGSPSFAWPSLLIAAVRRAGTAVRQALGCVLAHLPGGDGQQPSARASGAVLCLARARGGEPNLVQSGRCGASDAVFPALRHDQPQPLLEWIVYSSCAATAAHPVHPHQQIFLASAPEILATRLIDLIAPIGRGQRGLIVSPPKAGKTMLLKAIANGITANAPDIHLMVVLVGERPEEVTDMRRSVNAEMIASTFDEPVEDHIAVAELSVERAKRLVEQGRDVALLLDSVTRLARAYNVTLPPSGRTLSGGLDSAALYPPKRFFGAARTIEQGGSLTIIATCLVSTGSKMDNVIYEEFKGTGNMELHLDRELAERRIWPAINIHRSGTRREELLLDGVTLRQAWALRRMVSTLGDQEGIELLLARLAKTRSNAEFLATLCKRAA